MAEWSPGTAAGLSRGAERPGVTERLAGRIILLWGWKRFLLAFAAGALAVLAQPPFDFPAVCFVSFPVLVWLLDGAVVTGQGSLLSRGFPFFAVGWWFGFGYFLSGLWWLGSAVLVEAESFAWALPFAVLGPPLVLAFFFGFAALLARPLWDNGLGRIAGLAFAFGLAEWLRNWLFTGFPWNPLGYAAMPVPLLMQAAHLIGTFGMNAVAVFVFCVPALLSGRRHLKAGLCLAALLLVAQLGYGAWRLEQPLPGETLAVRIVQPSIDLAEKWDGAVRDRIFATTLDLSKGARANGAAQPQLILWPETSVPFLLTERPDSLAALRSALSGEQILLAGAVRAEGEEASGEARYTNSVVAVDATGTIADAGDKVHLVPFGEYLPFAGLFAWFGIEQLVAGPMTFEAGAAQHSFTLPGGLRGALALALALGLPADVPLRGTIVTVAFGVVAFSIVVQGLTMTPLLRRLGQMPTVGAASHDEAFTT